MGRLHEHVKSQSILDVKKVLRTDNPNERDNYYQTPLHVACGTAANTEIVKLLLRRKADVNVQDRNGWTPLHCSASEGQLAICELLLTVDGIDVGVLNKDGTSVLHYLVRTNPTPPEIPLYKNVLRLYVEKRGDINSQSKHGEAALHQACLRGNVTAVKFLLENKAAVNILNKISETALHYAVRAGNNNKECVQLLLEYGIDTSIKSEDGTPLELAPTPELANIIRQYNEKNKITTTESNPTSGKAGDTEEVTMYDISEFKLRVKVIRAVNLTPVGEKNTANSYCQLSFNKQKKITKSKPATLSPKWNEVFLFDIEDLSYPLKLSLYEQEGDREPTKEDLLGSVTVSLNDLEVDMTGEGNPLKAWYTLKRKPRRTGYKQTPKLRVEFSYILKSKLDEMTGSSRNLAQDSDDDETSCSESKDDSVGAFGWRRGKCKIGECDCDAYQPESARGGQCQNCGHWPAQHENLGKNEPNEPPNVDSPLTQSQSEGGESTASLKEIAKDFESNPAHILTHNWEISSKELQFSKRLGEGTSAQVFYGTYRSQEVAIKVLKDKAEAKVAEEFAKECDIMKNLRSPHVVFFYGACLQPSMCMVLEFCHKGSLYDVLNDLHEEISWPRVFRACNDTIKGLICLHNWKPQIVHRDMKSLNLLVDNNWTVKVSDFGTSRFTEGEGVNLETLGKLRGTYAYCAPEVYFGEKFTPKSDIYSFGVILWEICYRCLTGKYEQPFSEFKQIVFDFQIIIQSAKKDVRPTIPESCPAACADLITRCWQKKPEDRPTSEEVAAALKEVEKLYYDNKKDWDARCVPSISPSG